MQYEGSYPPIKKGLLPYFWRFLAHTFVHCISGKKTGNDEFHRTLSSAIVAVAMDWDYNFSKYVFDEMKSNMSGGRGKIPFLMYPRFLQTIFDEDYPDLERSGDIVDVKGLNPSTFSHMTTRRKKDEFKGVQPLVKFGRFVDDANDVVDTPPAQNEEFADDIVAQIHEVNMETTALEDIPEQKPQLILTLRPPVS